MRKTHSYPLTPEALVDYCHPRPDHPFHAPLRWKGGLAACNGWLALHVTKGQWLDHEHPEASGEALERLERLPWANHLRLPANDGWTPLDDHTGTLFRFGEKPVWTSDHIIISSALWSIADCFIARLSLLQLIARLPRVEIYPPTKTPHRPMAFRFKGGSGLMAPIPASIGHTPAFRFLKPRTILEL